MSLSSERIDQRLFRALTLAIAAFARSRRNAWRSAASLGKRARRRCEAFHIGERRHG